MECERTEETNGNELDEDILTNSSDVKVDGSDKAKQDAVDNESQDTVHHLKLDTVHRANHETVHHAKREIADHANQETVDCTKEGKMDRANQENVDHKNQETVDHANQVTLDRANQGTVNPVKQNAVGRANRETVDNANQETVEHADQAAVNRANQGIVDSVNQDAVDCVNQETVDPVNQKTSDNANQEALDNKKHEAVDHGNQETVDHKSRETIDHAKQETVNLTNQDAVDRTNQQTVDHVNQETVDNSNRKTVDVGSSGGDDKAVKIVVFGKDGAGKTALIVRLLTRRFIHEYDPTSEDVYTHHCVTDGEDVMLKIMDTAGMVERNMHERENQIRWGDGFLLVLSLTNEESLKVLHLIRALIEQVDCSEKPLALVATKSDLLHAREVTASAVAELAERWNCIAFETAATADYTMVEKPFLFICNEVTKKKKKKNVWPTKEPQSSAKSSSEPSLDDLYKPLDPEFQETFSRAES